MSTIIDIDAEIYDLSALGRAAERFQGKLNIGQKEFVQYGHRRHSCEHAISFLGEDMEVGVLKDGAAYRLKCDSMLRRKVGSGAGKLLDAYEMEKAAAEARAMGYDVHEFPVHEDGTHETHIYVREW